MLATEVVHRARDGGSGSSSAAATRPTWRRRTGRGCRCCATSPSAGDAVPSEVTDLLEGEADPATQAPEAGAAAATTLRTFAAVARLLGRASPDAWSC